ncbi:MAG: phosphoribosylanthranilate isomerase [Boseongicola sp. SB0677_bin_26]|nr:phosphoribosylanthranilate isomerase [Boseongicola sp. SB0665_bin_10]MYG28746.1 phosphoribosylanthranilate isomerase [Boseongicola sp. SB0677_bin_26]
MKSGTRVKICGLSTADTLSAAVEFGAAYVGFVFFPPSPRNLEPAAARALALDVPPGVAKVALTVDADDAFFDILTAEVPLDMLQLHGSETPQRAREVRHRTRLPVMKAIGISDADDVAKIEQYEKAVDQILIDARPPKDGKLPGGNGLSFDWTLIAGRRWTVPWMLAGGLTFENVAEGVALTGARQVDVSSGVESAPGVKDADLVRRFLDAVP